MRKIITIIVVIMMAFAGFADQYLLKLKTAEKPYECWSTIVIDAQTYSVFLSLCKNDKKPITKNDVTTTQLDIEKVNKLYKDLGQPVSVIDAKLVYYEFVGEKY